MFPDQQAMPLQPGNMRLPDWFRPVLFRKSSSRFFVKAF